MLHALCIQSCAERNHRRTTDECAARIRRGCATHPARFPDASALCRQHVGCHISRPLWRAAPRAEAPPGAGAVRVLVLAKAAAHRSHRCLAAWLPGCLSRPILIVPYDKCAYAPTQPPAQPHWRRSLSQTPSHRREQPSPAEPTLATPTTAPILSWHPPPLAALQGRPSLRTLRHLCRPLAVARPRRRPPPCAALMAIAAPRCT